MGLVTPTEPVPLEELGRVHFVGIGGAGMSGIARIMLARGTRVSGSDSGASAALDELAALGARVHVGHAAEPGRRRRHAGRVERDPRRATRSSPRPGGAACGCCTGRARSRR